MKSRNERALWLADKLVGDYGSEAAQLLREYASEPRPTEWCKSGEFGCECGRMEDEPCPHPHPGAANMGEHVSESKDTCWKPFKGYAEASKSFGGEGQGVSGTEFIFRHDMSTGGIFAMALPPLPKEAQ